MGDKSAAVDIAPLRKAATYTAFQVVMHTLLVGMALLYMSKEGIQSVSPWVLVLLPLVTGGLDKLTKRYKFFHVYVVQRLIVLGAVVVSVWVWREIDNTSTLYIQLVFLFVLSS